MNTETKPIIIDKEKCVGCGKCVAACPRGVIKIVPAAAEYHVYCNSPEKGAAKRQFCKAGCIGCRKCEKVAPGKFKISGFLSGVNYESGNYPDREDVEKIKCPVNGLLDYESRIAAARAKAAEEGMEK